MDFKNQLLEDVSANKKWQIMRYKCELERQPMFFDRIKFFDIFRFEYHLRGLHRATRAYRMT